jgi:hypothetical protein
MGDVVVQPIARGGNGRDLARCGGRRRKEGIDLGLEGDWR